MRSQAFRPSPNMHASESPWGPCRLPGQQSPECLSALVWLYFSRRPSRHASPPELGLRWIETYCIITLQGYVLAWTNPIRRNFVTQVLGVDVGNTRPMLYCHINAHRDIYFNNVMRFVITFNKVLCMYVAEIWRF